MHFDQDSNIVKLCAHGMELEGQGKNDDAAKVFKQAWATAVTDIEKLTAAHYVARHQETIGDKLRWDTIALEHALKIPGEAAKATFPSLYLNIAKCYEDLGDMQNAKANYELAHSHTNELPADGYGNMIRKGIAAGLERLA